MYIDLADAIVKMCNGPYSYENLLKRTDLQSAICQKRKQGTKTSPPAWQK
jgi:hypothetical protein